jgi:hypothetical protein
VGGGLALNRLWGGVGVEGMLELDKLEKLRLTGVVNKLHLSKSRLSGGGWGALASPASGSLPDRHPCVGWELWEVPETVGGGVNAANLRVKYCLKRCRSLAESVAAWFAARRQLDQQPPLK